MKAYAKVFSLNLLYFMLSACQGFAQGGELPKLDLEEIVSGLDHPIQVLSQPGFPSRLLVVEQKGKVRVVENSELLDRNFVDLSSKVKFGGERGLLGMAFHPRFLKYPLVYLSYTAELPKLTLLVKQFKISPGTGQVDLDSGKTIISAAQPFTNHNGGGIAFGPDGHLYIGVGDGGAANDPKGHGQNTQTLLGTMLRIDVSDGSDWVAPIDNPFALKESKGLPEIYAWGLRNPWRFSFDSETGELWVADVGQNKTEEINIVEKGKNYGWNFFEGNTCQQMRMECTSLNAQGPIFTYDHSWKGLFVGNSVTGGYVYRGEAIPALSGKYVYGDYQSGRIWALNYDRKSKTVIWNKDLIKSDYQISSFFEDEEGELYILAHKKGALFKLIPGGE